MEKQRHHVQRTTPSHSLGAPVQQNAGQRMMPPPAFQLQASGGTSPNGVPLQRSLDPSAPVQKLGAAQLHMAQLAGTCGLYSLINSIVHLYQISKDKDYFTVRSLLLEAAGEAGQAVTGQGEITSFAAIQAVVTIYNRKTENFKVNISQQTVDHQAHDQNSWRTALGIDQEANEANHAATLAIDSRLYAGPVGHALKRSVEAEDEIDGVTVTKTRNTISVTGLAAANASTNGSSAHWVTVTRITPTHLEVQDPNYPKYTLRFLIGEASRLTTSLNPATRGTYLDTVYGGAGKEGDFVDEMDGGKNHDYRGLTGMKQPKRVRDEVTNRLENTDRTSPVALNGLALKVERA